MNDITTTTQSGLSVEEILWQKKRMAELMGQVLKKDVHYGVIPGTKKPTLYKSGAEIVGLTFGIHPEIEVKQTDLPNGHREYEVICRMYRNSDGMQLAHGVGMCSTMESKYRWRTVTKFNPETKAKEETRIENPNIEDLHNTVLKMAKKRGFVDAILTSTAASDFFDQDIEDMEGITNPAEPQPWEAEINMLTTIEELKKYWEANKGKGKKFDQKIMERKNQLEANQPTTDENLPNN